MDKTKSPTNGNILGANAVKWGVRSVLLIPMIAFVASANAQVTLSEAESRATVADALNSIKVYDTVNPNAYSFVLKMDSTDSLGSFVQNYTGWVRVFHDTTLASEQVKAEMSLYLGATPLSRTVADGKRVWGYDPSANAYSVNTYNVESGANSPTYLADFRNFFNQGITGTPQNFLILLDHIGIGTASRARDWIGGIPFQGQETADAVDPMTFYRTLWQSVPGNARYVRYDVVTTDNRATWSLSRIEISKTVPVAAGNRTVNSIITVEKDAMGIPLTLTTMSPEFRFIPPARSKVLATPRTVKF